MKPFILQFSQHYFPPVNLNVFNIKIITAIGNTTISILIIGNILPFLFISFLNIFKLKIARINPANATKKPTIGKIVRRLLNILVLAPKDKKTKYKR